MNNNPASALPHPTSSAIHYYRATSPSGVFWMAALVALGLHAFPFLLLNKHPVRIKEVVAALPVIIWETPPPVPDDAKEDKPRELSDENPSVHVPQILDLPRPVNIKADFNQLPDPTVPVKLDGKEGIVSIPIRHQGTPVENDNNPRIFRLTELDRAPEAIATVSPDYPFELKREGLGGNVRIGFIVDSHGNVISPYIISSSHKGFERAAIDALAKWKFRPGMKSGKKVNTRMEQPIDFNMQS